MESSWLSSSVDDEWLHRKDKMESSCEPSFLLLNSTSPTDFDFSHIGSGMSLPSDAREYEVARSADALQPESSLMDERRPCDDWISGPFLAISEGPIATILSSTCGIEENMGLPLQDTSDINSALSHNESMLQSRWADEYSKMIINPSQIYERAATPSYMRVDHQIGCTSDPGGHLGVKLYRCTFPRCLKTCKRVSDLNKHNKTHYPELRKFECSMCFERFTYEKDQKRHQASRHHGNVPFPCYQADCERASRGFSRQDKRDEHMRKLHQKSFTLMRSSSYSTGRSNHQSDAEKSDFNGVWVTDQPTKLFRCLDANCQQDYGFKTSHDLRRHQRSVHSDSLPETEDLGYRCMSENCNRSKLWKRLDNLRQHIARLHPEEGVEALIQRAKEADARKINSFSLPGILMTSESDCPKGKRRTGSQ